jgi:two-component system, OmpR family, response regulator
LQEIKKGKIMSASTDTRRILVVDDDAELRELIGEFLRGHGFEVHLADGGKAMRALLEQHAVDVVILDVMMPGEDGLSLARSLADRADLAVIMVSALGSETDRIVGLEVGADDYLAKPISPRELIARIRAVLRRRDLAHVEQGNTPVARGSVFLFEGWRCDVIRGSLHDPGQTLVSLSQGEFSLLRALLEHPQRILTREQLLDYSRNRDNDTFDRAIDTQISRLRQKLSGRSTLEFIRTVRNEGYFWVPKVQRR